jgi:purine-binding chemotaxis protein CheW
MDVATTVSVLVVFARGRACALRATDVIETMRPLPIEPLPAMPPFMRGAAIIRGASAPVIDLGALLGSSEEGIGSRFVTIRAGAKTVALCVDAVADIQPVGMRIFEELPPLLRDVHGGVIEALGALNNRLLFLLNDGRALPTQWWTALKRGAD